MNPPFIKPPKQITSNQISKFQLFLYSFLIQCCVIILDITNLEFFEYLEKTKIFGNLKLVITENPQDVKFKSQTIFFIFACFIGPFLEEIIYRLLLLKKYSFLLFLPLISFFFYGSFGFSFFVNCLVILLVIIISVFYYHKASFISNNLRQFIINYCNLIYSNAFSDWNL